MNGRIKYPIKKNKSIFQKQKESNAADYAMLTDITLQLSNGISLSKAKYHEILVVKLIEPKTAPKIYWSILKTFVNGSKVPLIPSLLKIRTLKL